MIDNVEFSSRATKKMRQFSQRIPKDPQGSMQGNDRSKVILNLWPNLGAIAVPSLQAARQSAIEVIEAAKVSAFFSVLVNGTSHQAQLDTQEELSRRSECEAILNDTRELVEGIDRSLEGLTEADIDVRLKEDIKSFVQ